MKWLAFLLLILNFSFGQNKSSKKTLEFQLVERALSSMVVVAFNFSHDKKRNSTSLSSDSSIIETVGFIAKDSHGNIGVITSFNIIDEAVNRNGIKSLVVYNSANQIFKIKGIGNIDPVNNLIFLKMEGDLTKQGQLQPLPVSQSRNEEENLFYILREPFEYSSQFQWKPIESVVSLSDRQDFLIRDSYDSVKANYSHRFIAIPVINQKGEVVSFVTHGSAHVLYGVSLPELRGFLSSFEYNSNFLRGNIFEARRALYTQALQGNSRARYMLMLLVDGASENFKTFVSSIGITPVHMKAEWEGFWERAVEWNGELYYNWLIKSTNLSKEEERKHFEFLEKKSSIKSLAEQGHPHFQYFLGFIYSKLENALQAEHWIKKAGESGYIPGLWQQMLWHFSQSLDMLKHLANKDYALAQQLLGFMGQDLEKVKDIIEKYNGVTAHLPKTGHSQSLFQRILSLWRLDISVAEKEADTYESSAFFSRSVRELKESLDLLKTLSDQNYEPARKLQNRFGKYMKEELNIPIYHLSEELNQRCEKIFNTYFKSSD